MKRSKSLVLTSMMAGGSLALHACDDAPPATQWGDPPAASSGRQVEAQPFATVAQCEAAGTPRAQCETAYQQALADNEANAPRFNDRQSCEERYGVEQCVPRNNGSFFTPLLTGFILGQALNGGFGGGRGYYRDRYGNDSLSGGGRLGRDYVTGRTRVGSDAFGPPATRQAPAQVQSRSGVVSRGGFGGGGRGYS
jgi:uncharacterized protein YgiB involved in biofilm formation